MSTIPPGLLDAMFQSTPVITDGRALGIGGRDDGALFQSTPVITDGRALVVLSLEQLLDLVSIHARHH